MRICRTYCVEFHTEHFLGLPNSGINVPYSVYKLNAATARDSFAYNVGFGIEGTAADIVLLAACVLLYFWGRKHGKKSMDVWAET